MRMGVRLLAFLSGLRIWCCHELWCRSQTQLVSGVAVAVVVAGIYSSLAWEPPCATNSALKSKKKKKKKNIIFKK